MAFLTRSSLSVATGASIVSSHSRVRLRTYWLVAVHEEARATVDVGRVDQGLQGCGFCKSYKYFLIL